VNDDYAQLRSFGFIYPVGDLLRFGTKACALCKLWHHSYEQWTDIREPVLVLGPDACSTLTITNYFVQAAETGRYFITDDIITPDFAATYDAFLAQSLNEQQRLQQRLRNQFLWMTVDDAIYRPGRDHQLVLASILHDVFVAKRGR